MYILPYSKSVKLFLSSKLICAMSYLDVILPKAGVMFSPAVLGVAAIALLAYVVKVVFFPPKPPVLPFPVSTIKPGNLTDTILEGRKQVYLQFSSSFAFCRC